MSAELTKLISRARRDMPRNEIVLRLCSELEARLLRAPERKKFDKRSYMRAYMRAKRKAARDESN